MNTYEYLNKLFCESYSGKKLINVSFSQLKDHLEKNIGSIDTDIESFVDDTKQRDLSIKFHWGHNHDFGDGFSLSGRMNDRHIQIIAGFVDQLGLETDLKGKRILDIGVWTGGTSLLLQAMGAEIIAIEEVVKYADMVNYLAYAFGLEKRIKCFPKSLFDFLLSKYDEFDYIIYSGVIYHVSDPLLSLRLIFSALKDKGKTFIETFSFDSSESVCIYEGPATIRNGKREELNRGGWNYFIPSPLCLERWCRDAGFQDVHVVPVKNKSRSMACAERLEFQDFCRAGIACPNCR